MVITAGAKVCTGPGGDQTRCLHEDLAIVILLSRLMCALSEGAANELARALAWVWYWCVPVRLRVAADNLRRALPESSQQERQEILRACCTHQALYAMDVLRAPLMTVQRSEAYIARRGFEHLEAALQGGRGAIVFLSHYGSMDLMGFSQAVRGLPVVAVVRNLRSRSADRFVREVRERTGMKLLPPRDSWSACIEVLRNNGILALVVDQHMPKHRGVVCRFFGRLASTTPAPVRLAQLTGAPLHGAVIRRRGFSPQQEIEVLPPMVLEAPHADAERDVWHNTQRMTEVVEGWIREDPAPWLWMHRRWKVDEHPEGWELPPTST